MAGIASDSPDSISRLKVAFAVRTASISAGEFVKIDSLKGLLGLIGFGGWKISEEGNLQLVEELLEAKWLNTCAIGVAKYI